MQRRTEPGSTEEYDVFISHATEDKDFAAPLASALSDAGLKVWYDEYVLSIGDSLRQSIDTGLARSRFGIVVISPYFLQKNWTQYELDGLHARQMTGERVILPIWHRITKDEIMEQAPSLVDIIASNSSTHSIEDIAAEIAVKVKRGQSSNITSQATVLPTPSSGSSFGVVYVAQANTPELPPDEKPERSFLDFVSPPTGWMSVLANDEELEFRLEGTKLRVSLDWGSHWSGDEMHAHQMMSDDQPFALTIRPSEGDQIYLPSVVNISPSQSFMGRPNRSGWMVFEIED